MLVNLQSFSVCTVVYFHSLYDSVKLLNELTKLCFIAFTFSLVKLKTHFSKILILSDLLMCFI